MEMQEVQAIAQKLLEELDKQVNLAKEAELKALGAKEGIKTLFLEINNKAIETAKSQQPEKEKADDQKDG